MRWACDGATNIAALVPMPQPPDPPDWALAGFGLTIGTGQPVPLPVGMARWYLDGRPATVVGTDAELAEFDAVLVIGDGSASRSEKAPGHLHPEAAAFDDLVLNAIAGGEPKMLAALDPVTASEVGAAGASAWCALGDAVAEVDTATVDVQDDPYGVLYVVARWTVRWADPA